MADELPEGLEPALLLRRVQRRRQQVGVVLLEKGQNRLGYVRLRRGAQLTRYLDVPSG